MILYKDENLKSILKKISEMPVQNIKTALENYGMLTPHDIEHISEHINHDDIYDLNRMLSLKKPGGGSFCSEECAWYAIAKSLYGQSQALSDFACNHGTKTMPIDQQFLEVPKEMLKNGEISLGKGFRYDEQHVLYKFDADCMQIIVERDNLASCGFHIKTAYVGPSASKHYTDNEIEDMIAPDPNYDMLGTMIQTDTYKNAIPLKKAYFEAICTQPNYFGVDMSNEETLKRKNGQPAINFCENTDDVKDAIVYIDKKMGVDETGTKIRDTMAINSKKDKSFARKAAYACVNEAGQPITIYKISEQHQHPIFELFADSIQIQKPVWLNHHSEVNDYLRNMPEYKSMFKIIDTIQKRTEHFEKKELEMKKETAMNLMSSIDNKTNDNEKIVKKE